MTVTRECLRHRALRRARLGRAAIFSLLAVGACEKEKPPPPPPPAVQVANPVTQEVIEWDEYTGRLQAVESVDVRARVSGEIIEVLFEEGAIVAAGDVLVKIDDRSYQAELASRKAEEARAKAQRDLAAIELRRIENIPEGAATANEQETAQANLREAEAQVAAAQAAVRSAELNVEWCTVKAPIAGRTSLRYETEGNLITGGGEQGTLLTTITSIDPIYCYVDADERSVLKYQRLAREGERASARETRVPCYLQLIDEQGFPHEGYVDFVDNRMDPTTGTIRARGVFPNPEGLLTPGFFARLRVPGSGRHPATLVPDAAVISDQNRKLLLVVGADNKIVQRPVRLGALFGNLRAIRDGIDPSDRVVIQGLMSAMPGAVVNPTPATFPVNPEVLLAPAGEVLEINSNGAFAD